MLNVFACKCVVWTLSFDLSVGKVWILWLIFLNFSLLFFGGGGSFTVVDSPVCSHKLSLMHF